MASKSSGYYSIRIAQFLMKAVGFWHTENPTERLILNGILTYTLLAVAIALGVESLDFYYSWGDFYALTYTACSTMPVIIVLLKISIFLLHRTKMMKLIKYTQENFWQPRYDAFGKKVLDDIDNKGILLMCSFTFFVQGTVVTYTLTPIVENAGKNESDRILPFKLWIDIPTTTTPYFEVFFTIEYKAAWSAEYKHKPVLSIKVSNALKPVYEELTSDNLTRCIGSYTQNSNENFNSTVWVLDPKSTSSGKIILDVFTDIAICVYNDEFSSILHIMEAMGLEIDPNSYEMCMEIDKQRIKLAERSLSERVKEARIASRSSKKEKQEQDHNLEGL